MHKSARKKCIQDFFILEASKIHGTTYDYSKVVASHKTRKVIIICRTHGEFTQTVRKHLLGQGCPACGQITTHLKKTHPPEIFLERARKVHGEYFEYPMLDYKGIHKKVTMICPKHGPFIQEAQKHTEGDGCRFCSANGPSIGEQELAAFVAEFGAIKTSDRSVLYPLEIDCLLPERNIGFEFCGLYYHSESFKRRDYHFLKFNSAQEKGVALLHVFEDEWYFKRSVVESTIRYKLGDSEVIILASVTDIKNISETDSFLFIKNNSLLKYEYGEINIGLFNNDILVALLSLSHPFPFSGRYRISFYGCAINTYVTNGLNKLLLYFIENYSPEGIMTDIDLRFNLCYDFIQEGFTLSGITEPTLYYSRYGKRYIGLNYKDDNFKSIMPKFDSSLGLQKNLEINNCRRIFDCGNAEYYLSA